MFTETVFAMRLANFEAAAAIADRFVKAELRVIKRGVDSASAQPYVVALLDGETIHVSPGGELKKQFEALVNQRLGAEAGGWQTAALLADAAFRAAIGEWRPYWQPYL